MVFYTQLMQEHDRIVANLNQGQSSTQINSLLKTVYDEDLADFEAKKGGKASAQQRDLLSLWNTAEQKVISRIQEADKGSGRSRRMKKS